MSWSISEVELGLELGKRSSPVLFFSGSSVGSVGAKGTEVPGVVSMEFIGCPLWARAGLNKAAIEIEMANAVIMENLNIKISSRNDLQKIDLLWDRLRTTADLKN
jgi:hypothetical protein